MIDDYTVQHLTSWLESQFQPSSEAVSFARVAMLAYAVSTDDVTYTLNLGWPRVFELAGLSYAELDTLN